MAEEQKPRDISAIVAILLILGVMVLAMIAPRTDKEISYSEFLSLAQKHEVENLLIKGDRVEGRIKAKDKQPIQNFHTFRVDPPFASFLDKQGIDFRAQSSEGIWGGILGYLIPIVVLIVVIQFLASQGNDERRMGGGLLSIGRSRARVYMEKEIKVTFSDVAGVDEAKEELLEIVTFLKEPDRYKKLGGMLPKGILLVGPPGTGKTLLAKAVAGEAGVPFFSISGSEFVELFVGVGAARVRDLFEQAKNNSPCIIFIDELDAIGRARGVGSLTGGPDEKEHTLNQLLAELDGFDSTRGVVLLSATNRPEILDSALLRPGRFDRQVLVDRPDIKGRRDILAIHLKGILADESVAIDDIAAMTSGFTGADLANLVNEATLLAARRNADSVTSKDFEEAMERIIAGLEKKNRLLNERERKVVAYHEMGHALVSLMTPSHEPIQKISIIPRGIGALGYTIQRPTEDRFLMSKQELEDKMTTLLGGRAAEQLVFGELSTGAADDFVKATNIARNMVTRFGMSETLGMVAYDHEESAFLHRSGQGSGTGNDCSEQTSREIECAIKALIDEAFLRATEILKDKIDILEKGAERLLEKETLVEQEIEELVPPISLAEESRKNPLKLISQSN